MAAQLNPDRAPGAMSEAIALSSPSGGMSARARKRADERLRVELFGKHGLERPGPPPQPSEREYLLRKAAELRALAGRGVKPMAYRKEAERLEREASTLRTGNPILVPISEKSPGWGPTFDITSWTREAIKEAGNIRHGFVYEAPLGHVLIEFPEHVRTSYVQEDLEEVRESVEGSENPEPGEYQTYAVWSPDFPTRSEAEKLTRELRKRGLRVGPVFGKRGGREHYGYGMEGGLKPGRYHAQFYAPTESGLDRHDIDIAMSAIGMIERKDWWAAQYGEGKDFTSGPDYDAARERYAAGYRKLYEGVSENPRLDDPQSEAWAVDFAESIREARTASPGSGAPRAQRVTAWIKKTQRELDEHRAWLRAHDYEDDDVARKLQGKIDWWARALELYKAGNPWPFSKSKPCATKPSSVNLASALKLARKAGDEMGDTGLFDQWLCSAGLHTRGGYLKGKLEAEFRKGVEQGGVKEPGNGDQEAARYKGVGIHRAGDEYYTDLDPETMFESVKLAKAFIGEWKKRANPGSRDYDWSSRESRDYLRTLSVGALRKRLGIVYAQQDTVNKRQARCDELGIPLDLPMEGAAERLWAHSQAIIEAIRDKTSPKKRGNPLPSVKLAKAFIGEWKKGNPTAITAQQALGKFLPLLHPPWPNLSGNGHRLTAVITPQRESDGTSYRVEPIAGPEGMIFVEGAFPSRAQAERTVLEAVREALCNVEGKYEVEFSTNGHGSSNPADHYKVGYRIGLKLGQIPKYKFYTWENVKQAEEDRTWRYGHKFPDDVEAGSEYTQGMMDGFFEAQGYGRSEGYGVFLWTASGVYKSPVKSFDSETKARRWLEANRDTLPLDPAGQGYVVRRAEVS